MRWPKDLAGLCYGGDWNPEQWPESIWREDLALMRRAGVNLVSVGVFAWAKLEPEPGRFSFDWLDRVLDQAHQSGIKVNLATPTAAPPPWFSLAHPDALPVTAEGIRLTHGSRDTYCVSAPTYRAAAGRIATALADRYAHHPAVAMWHVHNEYGSRCYCDYVAAAFRDWLRARYRQLDELNHAWGTDFWGQRYHAWEQVLPPRATQYLPNPHQALDFQRFLSDELRAAFIEQRDVLRAANPLIPVTTNLAFGEWVPVDHRRWAAAADLVALDVYPDTAGTGAEEQTAFMADLARHWAGGGAWLLLEQAPGTLTQAGTQIAKEPGRMARLSLSHLARGSRGVMFFQWRASAAGAEQYHSALVPHAGPDSRIFREACQLGAVLPRLAEADRGSVPASVAIAWDAESWWAARAPHLPSPQLDYLAALRRAHRYLWANHFVTDFVELAGDLSRYRLVLVPSHYLATDAVTESVRRYVAGGGHLVVWYFSGIADVHGQVHLGGYPGGFRQVLGVRVEEFHPVPPGGSVLLHDGPPARLWSERVHLVGAEAVLRYADGALAGQPAVTRHEYGAGTAWYISTELPDQTYARVLAEAVAGAGAAPVVPAAPAGVEVVRRVADRAGWLFVLNHTDRPAAVPATGAELVTGTAVTGEVQVPAGGYAVVREQPSAG